MSAHEKTSPTAQHLCDLLLSNLGGQLIGVTRNHSKNWCTLGIGHRFAFVRHRRDGLTVYLLGKEADGSQLKALSDGSLSIEQRRAMGSPWAKSTPYYVNLDSEGNVQNAVPLLLYAAHQNEGRNGRRSYLMPSENSAREMTEGARITVQVSRIERDPAARGKCIEFFGAKCVVCGFDFGQTYGEIGTGFIHVHHLSPLATAKGRRKVDPKTDLRPVCPNCHEMLHRQSPPVTIEGLKARISGMQS
jgi:HNH endonuclease